MWHPCTQGALVDSLQKCMNGSRHMKYKARTLPSPPSFNTECAQWIWLRTEYFNTTIQTSSWLIDNPESGFLSLLLCVPPLCIRNHSVLNTADAEDAGWAQLYVNQAFSWNTWVSVVMLAFLNYNLVCSQWSISNCYDLEKPNSILLSD